MIRTFMDNWASFSKMDSSNISENCQSAVTKHFDEIIVVRARGAGGDPGHPNCVDELRI